MKKIKKDTVLLKVEGFAEGYYSEATAFGKIFVPKSVVDQDAIENLTLYVHELDGKHSEVEGEITVEELTVEQLVNENKEEDHDEDLNDKLTEMVIEYTTIKNYGSLFDLNMKLSKLTSVDKKEIELSEDTLIENVMIPKGTVLEYTQKTVENLDNFEFDLETDEE